MPKLNEYLAFADPPGPPSLQITPYKVEEDPQYTRASNNDLLETRQTNGSPSSSASSPTNDHGISPLFSIRMRSSTTFFYTSFSKFRAVYYSVGVVWSELAFDSARRGYLGILSHPRKVTRYASVFCMMLLSQEGRWMEPVPRIII